MAKDRIFTVVGHGLGVREPRLYYPQEIFSGVRSSQPPCIRKIHAYLSSCRAIGELPTDAASHPHRVFWAAIQGGLSGVYSSLPLFSRAESHETLTNARNNCAAREARHYM